MVNKRLNKEFLEKYANYDFTKIKEEKIFLVGSITKAKVEFYEIESILQIIHQKLVNICSVDGLLNKTKFSEKEWDKLQNIALRKLKQHDAILVLDVDGYIGEQSREEIDLFRDNLKKPVYFLSHL